MGAPHSHSASDTLLQFTIMNLGKCNRCAKTCYQLEGVTVGPPGKKQVFHKACFKCQNEGCNWQLTLTNYKFYEDKVYCTNHCPVTGFSNVKDGENWKAHGTTTTGAVSVERAMNAPKLNTVNEQLVGSRQECGSCGSVSHGGNFCSKCGERL